MQSSHVHVTDSPVKKNKMTLDFLNFCPYLYVAAAEAVAAQGMNVIMIADKVVALYFVYVATYLQVWPKVEGCMTGDNFFFKW